MNTRAVNGSDERPIRRRLPRGAGWALQIAFGAALLGFALWRVDLGDVAHALRSARYEWLALAALIYALTRVVHTVHLRVYLSKVGRVPLTGLFGAFVIANFINSVLPARVGDIALLQFVANRYGLSRAGMIAARAVETLLDASVLVALMLVAIAVTDTGIASTAALWALAAGVLGVFAASVIASRGVAPAMPSARWLDRLPARARAALGDAWPRVRDGLETLRNERLLALVVALTIVGYAIEVVTFWAFGRAFGLPLSLPKYVGVVVVVSFVRTFPITFQNIGTYEVALLALLGREGVSSSDALAYALASRILISAEITVMGLAAMSLMSVRPRDLLTFHTAERNEEPGAAPSVRGARHGSPDA